MDPKLTGGLATEPAALRSRREILLGGALAATAVAAYALQPRTIVAAGARGNIEEDIPVRIASWSVVPDDTVVRPSEDESAAARDYQAVVTRTYASPTEPAIMFVLAYAPNQSGSLIVHRPEICYPGAGFSILANEAATVPLARDLMPGGRFLSTERGPRIEQVLYWTRLGNSFPQSWDAAHVDLAWQNLHGLVPDGALARLSVIMEDRAVARRTLDRFAAALYAASNRDGRALLAGPARAGASA